MGSSRVTIVAAQKADFVTRPSARSATDKQEPREAARPRVAEARPAREAGSREDRGAGRRIGRRSLPPHGSDRGAGFRGCRGACLFPTAGAGREGTGECAGRVAGVPDAAVPGAGAGKSPEGEGGGAARPVAVPAGGSPPAEFPVCRRSDIRQACGVTRRPESPEAEAVGGHAAMGRGGPVSPGGEQPGGPQRERTDQASKTVCRMKLIEAEHRSMPRVSLPPDGQSRCGSN